MNKKVKVLFLGDIVGRPSRRVVKKYLSENKDKYDYVIANVENASHGFGLTKSNHDELVQYGIDVMTSGNHIWDKKDIYSYIDDSCYLIRPLNYNPSVQGKGLKVFDDIVVINLMGKTFMPLVDCPFVTLDKAILKLKEENSFENKIIFIDFHGEATAEKICFAKYAKDLGVSCVVGTHTHVQTADEKIMDGKLAYISDAGACASMTGVIGMKYDTSLKRILTSINQKFDIEDELPYELNAVEFEFEGNIPKYINRIQVVYNNLEEIEK
ncbi:YmdB family metallophosphoesterase [bacterium]|nr:YmdB family metallophosphoesterase [bacterium]